MDNENDSVSYKEIESEEKIFGDNDMLSAVVAVLCKADKLVHYLWRKDKFQLPKMAVLKL